jgi:hypothetical protein
MYAWFSSYTPKSLTSLAVRVCHLRHLIGSWLLMQVIVWKVFFKASWITFKSDFGPILGDLKATRERLNEEKLTSAVVEIQSLRAEVKDSTHSVLQQMEKNAEEERRRQETRAEEQRQFRLQSVLTKLGSPKLTEDQEQAEGQREISGSGTWIQQLRVFKDWLDARDLHTPPLIFLTGIPGAGRQRRCPLKFRS